MKKLLCAIIGLLFAVPAHATLPTGYTQLEYIESTGTQYIDTGFATSREAKFGIKFRDTLFQEDKGFFGSSSWVNSLTFYKGSANPNIRYCLNNTAFSLDITNATHSGELISSSSGVVGTFDGQEVSFPQITDNNSGDGNIYLFSGGRSRGGLNTKIDWFKIWDSSDNLVRDFVPAKRNSDGVVGMYDTVNNRFYTNAGSGSFVAGPETTGTCANMYDYNYRKPSDFEFVDGNTLRNTSTTNTAQFQLSIYDTINQEMAASKVITTPGNYNVKFNVVRDNNTMSMYHSGANGNLSFWTPKKINPGEYVLSFDVLSANPSVVGGLQLKNISLRPAYCSEIQVASTKYTETVFNPLNTALQNAISVVDSVVSNTITQAASIATLQSGKQTRPADNPTDANNTENCPAGKKCLLVTDTSGTPHWYEIFDPINRWMEGWIAAGKPAPNTSRAYKGDSAWRHKYIDGSYDTNDSQFSTIGGMYKTLTDGEWAEVYTTGDGTNAPVGVVYGTSKCTSVAGTNNAATENPTKFSELSAADQAKWAELPAPYGETDREGYERAKFTQCWCKMTAIGVPGADGTAANGSVYPVNVSSSAWVFNGASSPAADCAVNCAYSCVLYVRARASFRSALFGLSE